MEPQYGTLTRKNDFEKLEKIQKFKEFINKDYISREEGCIAKMFKQNKPYHTGRNTETTTSHIFLQGGRGADTSNVFL
jgi:hypothetical protein